MQAIVRYHIYIFPDLSYETGQPLHWQAMCQGWQGLGQTPISGRDSVIILATSSADAIMRDNVVDCYCTVCLPKGRRLSKYYFPNPFFQFHLCVWCSKTEARGRSLSCPPAPCNLKRGGYLLCIRALRRPDNAGCICCFAHIAILKRSAIFVDVNLLRVRASVHSSVSLPRYYIPVSFSKGSPVTSHLGRVLREL